MRTAHRWRWDPRPTSPQGFRPLAAAKALEERYLQLDIVEIDNSLALQAGELAETLGLRGHVHLTAARRVSEDDLVVVAGDRALLAAAKALGLKVAAIA